jgi:hypothetical protein
MATRSTAFWVVGIVMATAPLAAQAPAAPQAPARPPTVTRLGGNIRANPPSGPVPRLADGKPDMTGVWLGGAPVADISTALPKGEAMPFLPETRKRMQSQLAKDDPQANCLPLPPPRATPYPWRMVVTPGHVFFLYEMYGYRQVFMDGRRHPDDVEPTWFGHSTGRWEGDTLVVDTIGYNDRTWFDNVGHPHSEKLHTIERFTRTSLGTIAAEITIDDPGAYAKPIRIPYTARLMPGDELLEYICEENNQDVPHLVGPADNRGR